MRQLILILILFPMVASAECYMRSASVRDIQTKITRIVDIKRYVTPLENDQYKCTVTFRAEINHVWHNGEGKSIGAAADSIDQICSQAMDSGRSYLLSKISNGKITSESEMICTDRPDPAVKTVRIGDVVQISELAPHPEKPNFFDYKGTKCRWFVESDFDPTRRDLFQWQGIVCQVRKGDWQIIDKF